MKFRLEEKTLDDAVTINAPTNSEWVDVGGMGGDSIAFVMTATDASTPGTASITLIGSLDKSSLVTIGAAVTVSGNGTFAVSQDRPPYRYYRVAYAIASGSYKSTLKVLVKGDKE